MSCSLMRCALQTVVLMQTGATCKSVRFIVQCGRAQAAIAMNTVTLTNPSYVSCKEVCCLQRCLASCHETWQHGPTGLVAAFVHVM